MSQQESSRILGRRDCRAGGTEAEFATDLDIGFEPVARVGVQRVVELLSVVAPRGVRAAPGRDLVFSTWNRKRLNVELELAGLVGPIKNPPAVGRDLGIGLDEARPQVRLGLAIATQREHPDVPLRRGIQSRVNDILPVRRPTMEPFEEWVRFQKRRDGVADE